MPEASQEFCLFLDRDVQADLPAQTTPGGHRYFAFDGLARFSNTNGILTRNGIFGTGVLLESMRRGQQKFLLIFAEESARLTVNGIAVPRVCTLHSGDVLTLDDHVLYVSLLNRPYVGPPEEGHIGASCGFCRQAIAEEADMRVYVCPSCQLPTHFHDEDVPAERRLQCAKLSLECGHCQAQIIQREGFTYVPDL